MAEPRFFANIGPSKGPILYRDGHDAIGVHAFPDSDTEHLNMPIGMALGNRWDDRGRQLYRLTLKKGGYSSPGLATPPS